MNIPQLYLNFLLYLVLIVAGLAADENSIPIRMGVIGDSISSGYHTWKGDATVPRPKNWVAVLAETQRVDFGQWQESSIKRERPGYAHVWAKSGCTTAKALSEGLVQSAKQSLAAKEIDCVFVLIGNDDFQSLLSARTLKKTIDASDFESVIAGCVANINRILDELAGVGSGKIIICTIAPWALTPFVRNVGINAEEYRLLIAATERINDAIRGDALRRRLQCVDIDRYLHHIFNGKTMYINETLIETNLVGSSPQFFFLRDGMHIGTVGSAMCANEVITAMNIIFPIRIPMISSTETLEIAGLKPISPSSTGSAIAR